MDKTNKFLWLRNINALLSSVQLPAPSTQTTDCYAILICLHSPYPPPPTPCFIYFLFLSTVQISFNALPTRSVSSECELWKCTSALLKRNKTKCKMTQKHKLYILVCCSQKQGAFLCNLPSMIFNLSHGLYYCKIWGISIWSQKKKKRCDKFEEV